MLAWYRPPSEPVKAFHKLEKVLTFLDSKDKQIKLLGDTNCDLTKNPRDQNVDNNTRHLCNLYDLYNFYQLIMNPISCLSGEPLNVKPCDRRTELSDQVSSMSAIIPETFQTGDFVAWLRQFECCANANNWDAAAKLRKLPAFLCGPVAAYFHSLADAQKDTYAYLLAFLRDCLCPVVDRERFYAEFESRHLRPNEDPSLFPWALEDILSKADPDLSDVAKPY